jgi:hypothetical protein
MSDNDGKLLPSDFLIDAHLYPLDPVGMIYMSSVDIHASTIYFADTVTGTVVGKAVYTDDSDTAAVTETGEFERQIGLLVFGDGLNEMKRGRFIREFTPYATTLTPTAYTPIKQVGVRGIRLPDGKLISGDISFEGRDGVLITSNIVDGEHILRFDVLGVPPVVEDCGEHPLICTIIVERAAGSRFVISKYDDYTLALTANGLTLDDICAAAKARRRPDDRDPCETPLPPEVDPAPGAGAELVYQLCDMHAGTFQIVTPSSAGALNPISVRPINAGVLPNRMNIPPVTTLDDATKAAERFRLPDAVTGGILIEFQGIGKGQLP